MFSSHARSVLIVASLVATSGVAVAEDYEDIDMDEVRITVGLDLGAVVPATGSNLYALGAGKAYVVTSQFGNWRLDWRVGESYDLQQSTELGASVDGRFSSQSMSIGRVFGGALHPTLSCGAALLSTSLPTIAANGQVVASERDGVGIVLAAEVRHTLASRLDLVGSVRGYSVKWEQVPGSVITEANETGFMQSTAPEAGIPISANIGLRIVWE